MPSYLLSSLYLVSLSVFVTVLHMILVIDFECLLQGISYSGFKVGTRLGTLFSIVFIPVMLLPIVNDFPIISDL